MGNTYGNAIIVPLVNKSGGSVIRGDVVIIDTGNNGAFTTTTSAASLLVAGIVQESIANNATGRVLVHGYADLVNVDASVTRGNFGKTHTVAKQATDAGSSRIAGTFCRFLTGGTTPTAYVYPVDLAGAALTDPTSNRGEIIRRGAAALEALQAKTAGKVLVGDGTDVISAYPPGYEFDYAEFTGNVGPTATTEGGANSVVAGAGFTSDGSAVVVEFYGPRCRPDAGAASRSMTFVLYLDGSSVGMLGDMTYGSTERPVLLRRRHTPTAGGRTYSIRAFVNAGTGFIGSGAGGSGNFVPGYIRVTKA